MEKERGYTFCKTSDGKLCRGPQVTGGTHDVGIPVTCPSGSKPAALFHTHPGGDMTMSPRDIKTMYHFKMPVCIRAGRKVVCYRPRRK